jgi:hypothetical protein
MESVILLMILLGAFLLLLIAAALVFLYLQALRQMRLQAQEQANFFTKAAEYQTQLALNSTQQQENSMESARETMERTFQAAIEEMKRQQIMSTQAQDLTLTRALDGSNTTTQRLAQLLQSAVTMLATKDPIAYAQVYGPAAPQGNDPTPYTAVDEGAIAQIAAQQENLRRLDEAAQLLETLGVSDGGAGSGSFAFTTP